MELAVTELVGRLILAAGLGAVVGVERDAAARGAGARTHALVSLGAALFTVAGAYGFGDIERTANVDPARPRARRSWRSRGFGPSGPCTEVVRFMRRSCRATRH
jgi:putative Mg2+ transporter-C (MgtC) family protein